jgi:hypothetical protein
MSDFYEILRVSPRASNADIKSAYRRLARRLHPDRNDGSPEKTREFRKVVLAYETLGDPKKRAEYDHELLRRDFARRDNKSGILNSKNPYTRRFRKVSFQRRYDEIVDRMMADEQRKSITLRKAIVPLIIFLGATFLTAAVGPSVFEDSGFIGRLVLISFSVAGLIHCGALLKEGLENHTHSPFDIHDTVFERPDRGPRKMGRAKAVAILTVCYLIALVGGTALGGQLEAGLVSGEALSYLDNLSIDTILAPPIIVLVVDWIQSFLFKRSPRRA